ncbi:hypothetical protein [Bacillus mycoides]|nr:hypothetical protein [Bacillus mycoides]
MFNSNSANQIIWQAPISDFFERTFELFNSASVATNGTYYIILYKRVLA